MTLITELSPIPHRISAERALLSRLAGYGRSLAAQWRRHRDLAALESLPADLRKDIGWPDADMNRPTRKTQQPR